MTAKSHHQAELSTTASEIEKRSSDQLKVSLVYRDIKVEFLGTPETVLRTINSFIAKEIPEISLARRLSLNFSTTDLVNKFENFIRITPEGPRVWGPERGFSDKELVALQLVAARIASETSLGTEGSTPKMTLSELQETTSLNPKSLSSRLSELAKLGLVERESTTEAGTTFRITTQGVDWLANTLSKKKGNSGSNGA